MSGITLLVIVECFLNIFALTRDLDVPLGGSTQANGGENELMLQSSSAYIQEIRRRLQENVAASEQREKRRIRCLVEQLKAHVAQEVGHIE